MVRFEGTLSDECVLYRIKHSDRVVIIGSSIALVVGISVLLAMYFGFGYSFDQIKDVLTWLVILAVVILILIVSYSRLKKPRLNVCIELSVDDEQIEYSVAFDKETMPISKIKKVIKIGQRYYLIRKRGDVTTSLMAEESLLKEGTIEEFEAIFKGKIEVRTK